MSNSQKKYRRILLLEAPYSYGHAQSVVGSYFPLGIGYIAAYLIQNGYEVEIFQPEESDFIEELLGKIEEDSYDVVGFSVMTPSFPSAVRICDRIKLLNPNIITVMGGHHVSAVRGEVLSQALAVDFVIYGEGELALLALLEQLNSYNSFSSVDGLIWRDTDGTIIENDAQKFVKDIDKFPFPKRDLVDIGKFRPHSYIDFGKKSATMITSRGCPFRCMYCSSFITMGSAYRMRSVENVMEEIRELVDVYGVDHVVFEDDTMTLNRDRLQRLCRALTEMPNRPSWYCLSRVDVMDYDLAVSMKNAGCKMVSFGIESGSQYILDKIPKKITIDQAVKAVSSCSTAGLRTQCTFIVGFPEDTNETMKMTLEAAKKIKPTIAIFFPLTPYPGTKVFNMYMSEDLKPKDVNEWEGFIVTNNKSGISVNKTFSGTELKKIADEWNSRFYLRPSQIFRLARSVTSLSEFIRLGKAGIYLLRTIPSRFFSAREA